MTNTTQILPMKLSHRSSAVVLAAVAAVILPSWLLQVQAFSCRRPHQQYQDHRSHHNPAFRSHYKRRDAASFSRPETKFPVDLSSSTDSSETRLYNSKYSAGTTPAGQPSTTSTSTPISKRAAEKANAKPFSTTLLGAVLHKLWSPFAFLQRCLFRAVTKGTAAFLTAVISEPNCNHACATVIMRGCNMVLTSHQLKRSLVAAQTTLSQTEPSLAKMTGEDFFKVLIQFLAGVVDPTSWFDEHGDKNSSLATSSSKAKKNLTSSN